MTSTRVLLWRHGRTAQNHTRVWQGQLDTELDDVGRAQAARAARALARLLGGAPARVVTSDLRRAADTAAELTALLDIGAVPDPRLREVHAGRWEGLAREEIVAAGMAAELAAWSRGEDIRVGGTGERRGDVGRRGAAAIAEHAAAVAGGTLVVVSHGGVLRGSIMALLGLAADHWNALGPLGNAHWAELVVRTPSAVEPATPSPTASSTSSPAAPSWRLLAYNVCGPDA